MATTIPIRSASVADQEAASGESLRANRGRPRRLVAEERDERDAGRNPGDHKPDPVAATPTSAVALASTAARTWKRVARGSPSSDREANDCTINPTRLVSSEQDRTDPIRHQTREAAPSESVITASTGPSTATEISSAMAPTVASALARHDQLVQRCAASGRRVGRPPPRAAAGRGRRRGLRTSLDTLIPELGFVQHEMCE